MNKLLAIGTILCIFFLVYTNSFAQLSGSYTIPGSYATTTAAVSALNTLGISGSVTFNVAAGYTESITAPILLTATGTSSNTITFQKSGVGANPSITRTDAGSLSTSTIGGLGDAVIRLDGTDYITFDGIDVAASQSTIEYGYFTYKPSGTNGCQYVTIKNATITMTKGTSGFVIGIYISNGPTAVNSATGVTVTATSGINQNITITGNTVQNSHAGIYIRGSAAAGYNDNNIIVGQSGSGNIIQNFGGGSANTTYGVYFIYVINPSVSYNTINNAGGGGFAHGATLYGIFYSVVSGDLVGSNNTITLDNSSISATYGIYNANTCTSENFNNNTFSIGAFASTTSSYLIFASNATNTVNITGNSTSGTINKTGTGPFDGYYNIGATTGGTANISNNNFSNITVTGASTFYAIRHYTSTTQIINLNNNTISNITGGTNTIYGIYQGYGAAGSSVTGNSVYNFSSSNIIYGVFVGGTGASTSLSVSNNNIYNLSSTGAATVYGIYSNLGIVNSIYQNKIYNLSNSNSGGIVYGITIAGGTTNYLFNNFVSDLKTTAGSAANPISGIVVPVGAPVGSVGIYYNTIYLNAVSSGAIFGSSGIYTSTTPTVDMRNNIVVNTSTPNAGGYTVAYRRNNTTLTSYSASSNNNCFYAGTPGPNNFIYFDYTTGYQTIAAFKTLVTPRDAASFTELPPFVNVSSAPYDLHINSNLTTLCRKSGTPVSSPISITTDYDSDTRNASTPDVGADEFSSSPMSGTFSVGLTAFNKVSGKNLYVETIKRNVPGNSKINLKNSEENPSRIKQNTNFTNYSDHGNSGFETIGVLMENGKPYNGPLFYANNNNIHSKKNETKSIQNGRGDSPNAGVYATITAAINDVNSRGLSGAVTLLLTDATYPSETFPIVIGTIAGVSATNTITIKPSASVTPTISGSSASSIFKLNGSDYIIIDGSNSGGTSRDMTISNTNTSTSSAVFWIGSADATNGATYNAIKNCNITGNASTTTAFGICIGSGTTLGNIGEAANNNITILNNNIHTCQNGIFHYGIATGDLNYTVQNNTFGSSTVANYLGYRGAIFQSLQNFSIDNNIITGVSTPGTGTATAICITSASSNGTITRNTISNVKNTNAGGYGANGIYLSSTNTASNIRVYNNVVSDVTGYGNAGVCSTDNGYGIMIENGGGYSLYYNTVCMNTNQTSASGIPAALNIGTSITTANTLNIMDNLFVNTQTVGAYCYATFCSAASTVLNSADYNDYYVSDATSGRLGNICGLVQNTLTNWRTASGKDAFSVSGDPGFTSSMNFMPNVNSTLCWNVNGKGMPNATVTTDLNGNPRSTTTLNGATDIGAYEFTPVANPNDAEYYPSTIVDAGVTDFTVAGYIVTTITWHIGTGTLPTAVSVKYRSGENPPNPVSGAYYSNLNTVITPIGGSAGFSYDMVYHYTPALLGSISSESNLRIAKYDVSTGWVQWDVTPNITNKTVSVTDLTSFSTFTFGDHNFPMPVQIKSFISSVSGRDVALLWTTVEEHNNKGFEILRSNHGENNFSSISFINSNGNSNSSINYVYNDKKLYSGKYDYRLKQVDLNGHYTYFDLNNIVEINLPEKYFLSQNYPNPFNPVTKIDYDLPFDSKIKITVFDIIGREVKNLVNGNLTKAGYYTVDLNATNLASGVYFYRITAIAVNGKDFFLTKKMVVIK